MVKFLSEVDEERVLFAIQDAEMKTSGEIRVHVTPKCRGSIYDQAAAIFEKLGMTRTAERNGVMIYVAIKERQFAVIGDLGIHDRVGPDFWDKVRDALQARFGTGDFAGGLVDAVKTCGTELARYFPRRADDRNELPDKISSGEETWRTQ